MQIGIDNLSFVVGSKFKGVKMVPHGVHLLSYALKEEQYHFKQSEFMWFSPQERVIVRQWDG